MSELSRVVVGVDGSEDARAALRWAAREARVRHAELTVVHAWHYPGLGIHVYGPTAMPPLDLEDLRRCAQLVADAAADDAHAIAPGLEVRTAVSCANATDALLAQAHGADLLVLGTRGLSSVARALLGSTSHNCLHHATCPVVVVPSHGRRAKQVGRDHTPVSV